MKTITVRNIPDRIAEKLQERADSTGASLGRTALDLLTATVEPLAGSRVRFHDLDHLAGSWTDDDAREIDRSTAAQRTIDPELWS